MILNRKQIDTPLGTMTALADEQALYLLTFSDREELEKKIEKIRKNLEAIVTPGQTKITHSIETELNAYFSATLTQFKTPVKLIGSDFQKSVWTRSTEIPYGKTCSYAEQARALNIPKAVRAVANGNKMNPLAIIIPCHRVIGADGNLTGYAGGLALKKWLLEHEKALRLPQEDLTNPVQKL